MRIFSGWSCAVAALVVAVAGCTTATAGHPAGSAAACSTLPTHALGIRFTLRPDARATLPAGVPRPRVAPVARCRLWLAQLDRRVPVLAYPATVLPRYDRALRAAGWQMTDSAVVIGFYARPDRRGGDDLVLLLAGDYLLVGHEGG
jgi:hypothetical protein